MILLRSLLFNIVFLGGSALAAIVALLLLPAPRPWLVAYVRGWAKGVILALRLICGIRLRVTGLDHLPPGGFILAAKHQSAFDTVVWLTLLDRPVYVLKRELVAIPVWGWLARRCGHVAVDRKAGSAALKSMVREARAALAEGRPVVIFPEGTRSAPGARLPYQPGVAALAMATGAVVVPAATDSGLCWGRRAFRKPPGVIHVSVLPPLPPTTSRKALMAALETAIETETATLLAAAGYVDNSGGTAAVMDESRPQGEPTTI